MVRSEQGLYDSDTPGQYQGNWVFFKLNQIQFCTQDLLFLSQALFSGNIHQFLLQENVRLKVVNLAWNGLGEAGGIALADALIANNTITDLDISANRLTMNVAQKFVKTINVNDTLEVLKVWLTVVGSQFTGFPSGKC